MCEKCQDRGFIEENHGLIVMLCDCEKGEEYRAQREAILGIPKAVEEDTIKIPIEDTKGTGITFKWEVEFEGEDDKPKGLIIPEPIEGKTIKETVDIAHKIIEANNDSNIGTDTDNQSAGSPDTSQPKQSSKPKKKKKARKRTK